MRYFRFEFEEPEIHLFPFVCWHIGAKQSSEKFIAEVVRRVKDDPLARWLYLGDGGECVTKTSKGNIYEQLLNPGDQLRVNANILSPIRDKGLAFWRGNHGNRVDRDSGLGWDETLAARVGLPYLGVSALGDLILDASSEHPLIVSLYAHHGSASAVTAGGKNMAAHKPAPYFLADIVLTAHCFDEETELLTLNGWKKYQDLSEGDLAITWNRSTKRLEPNPIQRKVVYHHHREMVQIKNQNIDLLVTDEHGLIDVGNLDAEFFTAREFTNRYERKFLTGGWLDKRGVKLTEPELRLVVWVAADGSFVGPKRVRFHLKKDRKIKRLRSLADELGIASTDSTLADGSIQIAFDLPDAIAALFDVQNKRLPLALWDATASQVRLVLDEYKHTDGCQCSKGSIQISTYKECEADLLQEMCVTSGVRCNKTPHGGGWALAIVLDHPASELTTRRSALVVPYSGATWCVSVDNGTLLVRRNGKTAITQNTHMCGESDPPHVYAATNPRARRIDWKKSRCFVCGSAYDSRSGYAEEKIYSPMIPAHLAITIRKKWIPNERGAGTILIPEISHQKIEAYGDEFTNDGELIKWAGKEPLEPFETPDKVILRLAGIGGGNAEL